MALFATGIALSSLVIRPFTGEISAKPDLLRVVPNETAAIQHPSELWSLIDGFDERLDVRYWHIANSSGMTYEVEATPRPNFKQLVALLQPSPPPIFDTPGDLDGTHAHGLPLF